MGDVAGGIEKTTKIEQSPEALEVETDASTPELDADVEHQNSKQVFEEKGVVWGYNLMSCLSPNMEEHKCETQGDDTKGSCENLYDSIPDSAVKWMNDVQKTALCSSRAKALAIHHDYRLKMEELTELLSCDTSNTQYLV